MFQDYPPITHLNQQYGGREVARRQPGFPAQSIPSRKDISVKRNPSFILCFPCPLAMQDYEQEIISRIRANKRQGKLGWYFCHWPNIHVDTKPALFTHPLSTRDCSLANTLHFPKAQNLRGNNVHTLPKSISLISESIVWEQSIKGWDYSFIIVWASSKYFQIPSVYRRANPGPMCMHPQQTFLESPLGDYKELEPYLTHGYIPKLNHRCGLGQQSIQMLMDKLPTATHGASLAQQGQRKMEGISPKIR